MSIDEKNTPHPDASRRVHRHCSRTDHAIEDGTIPAVHVGRRVLIPRRPFLRRFGVDDEVSA